MRAIGLQTYMAHILLAEDDASMRKFLCAALEKAGHRVTERADGLSALHALDGPEAFDLLLADIVMPGIDGIELSQLAVKKRPHLKVMFITGFSAFAASARTQHVNARLMSKPFHLSELVKQVESILAST